MGENILNIKNLLDIIIKTTKKSTNILADRYLLKDVSIISKWRNNIVIPKNSDIAQIVEFTMNESTETQRRIIREEIEEVIRDSSLKEEFKNEILKLGSFNDFLSEALSISTSFSHSKAVFNKSIQAFPGEFAEEDYKTQNRKITSLEEGLDGEYSGVMNFDLVLKKKNAKGKSSFDGHEIEFTSNAKLILENNLGKLKRYVKTKHIVGILALGMISSFFIAYAAFNSHNQISSAVADATVKNSRTFLVQQESVLPKPTPKIPVIANDSMKSKTENAVPSSVPAVVITPAPVKPVEGQSSKPQNVQSGQNSNQAADHNSVNKKTDVRSSKSTTNQNIDFTGDSNITVQGSNNAISIGR